MGLRPDDFWDLTVHEFNLLMTRHNEKTKQEAKLLNFAVLNALMNANRGKGQAYRPFLDEESSNTKQYTREEAQAERELIFN